ncbi:cytochrome P450 [Aspergillus brunneoviolaceus CBS 621.78]|uniref:Cytochrome P450 n=1 Tax=Aspergillus brunneoviolaceus CBS 621.78 TaxID=1450534 RepID=A0ACD1FZT4_9EURO|nr:cytochrome P450 [Aspergillus brunneoviolaceus CBS 621.78]RAH42490.1 cytochrome P450 [Aspergillus brunneoviolaceus CBS 621.78]
MGQPGQLMSYEQTTHCPYLQAVIYEALRRHPVAPGPLQREVPEGGLQAAGYFVPLGVVVGTPAWVINRLPEIWGDEPDAIRPERWLDKPESVRCSNTSLPLAQEPGVV